MDETGEAQQIHKFYMGVLRVTISRSHNYIYYIYIYDGYSFLGLSQTSSLQFLIETLKSINCYLNAQKNQYKPKRTK